MSVIKTRGHQLFPVLDAVQLDTAKRFASGPSREFAPGEIVYDVAERHVPVWLVLKGSIDVVRRDGLNHEAAITSLGPGQFSGEVSQLAGAATLASGRAGPEGCTALPFDGAHVRALMVGSAEVGEIMMRAFILRRVGLIEEGGVGSVLVGTPGTPELVRLEGFLGRNGYPYTVLDASDDAEGRAIVERSGVLPEELPLMVCPNGTVLKRPTDAEAGIILGITPELDPNTVFDVAVVGAGPAGLAAAVYGASEGLSVLVPCFRRTGGRFGADRELSRLPNRHLRHGACRSRLQPGSQVRRRDCHSA
jgi:thioredoxin reductase (NADPH)